jgi:hypothetical protein
MMCEGCPNRKVYGFELEFFAPSAQFHHVNVWSAFLFYSELEAGASR